MVARDPERGVAALERVGSKLEDSGIEAGSRLELERCDLSDLDSVQAFATDFLRRAGELHGLLHNAGVLPSSRRRSPQGHELAFATNVLGPFLLTNAAAPLAARGRPVAGRTRLVRRHVHGAPATRRSRARPARVRRRARVRAHEADRGDPRRAVGGARARERRLVRVVSPRLGRHPRARVVAAPVPPAAATAAPRRRPGRRHRGVAARHGRVRAASGRLLARPPAPPSAPRPVDPASRRRSATAFGTSSPESPGGARTRKEAADGPLLRHRDDVAPTRGGVRLPRRLLERRRVGPRRQGGVPGQLGRRTARGTVQGDLSAFSAATCR